MAYLSLPHPTATPIGAKLSLTWLIGALSSIFSTVEMTSDDILAAQLRKEDARRAVNNLMR